jgi:hypothetical protein
LAESDPIDDPDRERVGEGVEGVEGVGRRLDGDRTGRDENRDTHPSIALEAIVASGAAF